MRNKTVEELSSELQRTYEKELCKPFPYAGSLKLRREGGDRYEGLIPDLDMYFYGIASHCGGIKKVLGWPKERLLESQEKLSKSFFDKYPQYRSLEPMITESNTPDLYAALDLHERTRIKLLKLLSQMLREQPSPVAA